MRLPGITVRLDGHSRPAAPHLAVIIGKPEYLSSWEKNGYSGLAGPTNLSTRENGLAVDRFRDPCYAP
jgi:hypothetical protein